MAENDVLEAAQWPQNDENLRVVRKWRERHPKADNNGLCAEPGCGKKIEGRIKEEFPQTAFCKSHQRTNCFNCGVKIPRERRLACNDAKYCITCQVEEEKKGMN